MMPLQASTIVRSALAVAVLVIAGLIAVLLSSSDFELTGQPDELGGDFTLRSIDGDVSLSDYKDSVVVVYFGFLSCQKVCPASMGVLKLAFESFEPKELEQIQGILVSIDPARDDFAELEDFTQKYHSNIVGVTGTKQQVEQVAKNYRAYFRKSLADMTEADEQSNYEFRHSSRFYIVNKDGKLVDAMRHSTTYKELAARIRTLI